MTREQRRSRGMTITSAVIIAVMITQGFASSISQIGAGGGGGSGTVTSVSVTTANGVSGTVATATTTPAITLSLAAITPTTVTPSGITGSTAASRYVGATASGAPASGAHVVGDWCIDQSGKVQICTANGTPGTWTAAGGGGGGSPGGSSTQLQYNSSGSFAGISGVTTDGTKLTAANTVLNGITSYNAVYANGNVTGATTINWNNGNVQSCILTGNATFTFTPPTALQSAPLQLYITQNSTGNFSVTWRTNTTQTASWTGSTTAVTLSGSNAAIFVGMAVTGTGIAPGTTVAAVSGTSLTLSQNSTGTQSGVTLTFPILRWAGGVVPTVTQTAGHTDLFSGQFGQGFVLAASAPDIQ